MQTKYLVFILFLPGLFLRGREAFAQNPPPLTTGSIIYNDSSLEKLISKAAKIEVIGSGFNHIESPVWVADSSMLLFSDTKAQKIYRWTKSGGLSVFLSPIGFTGRLPYSDEPGSNGLAVNKNGLLLICEHGDRRVASFPLNGKYGLKTVTDNYLGKRYNSPNDILVSEGGDIYFTDPPYGLPQKDQDPAKETPVNGVYQLGQNGEVVLLIGNLNYPNGLGFSPDGNTFYVSVSDVQFPHIMYYPVESGKPITGGKLFFDATALPKDQPKQVTDGFKVDKQGNLWASAPGGLLIIDPKGKLLGSINTGEIISNSCFNVDESELYLTAGSFLYYIKLK